MRRCEASLAILQKKENGLGTEGNMGVGSEGLWKSCKLLKLILSSVRMLPNIIFASWKVWCIFFLAILTTCRRIWTVFIPGLSGSIPKVTTLQRVQLLKDFTRFHRFTQGSQLIKMATRTQRVFRISPRRPSELLNPYIIAHTTCLSATLFEILTFRYFVYIPGTAWQNSF